MIGDGKIAIEAKISDRVRTADLRSMTSFLDEYPRARAIVVTQEPRKRVIELGGRSVEIHPWRVFCEDLWGGKIL